MGEQVAAGSQLAISRSGNALSNNAKEEWGCSSVGRAPALQAGGQGFESLYLQYGLIAQPVRAHA